MRIALAAIVATVAAGAAPPPDRPIPRDPERLAAILTTTEHDLDVTIDAWVAAGTTNGAPPTEVTLQALFEQRISRLLVRDERLAAATLPRLPSSLRTGARDDVVARRELRRLTPPARLGALRTGTARPAGELRRDYDEAERRFHVSWRTLAAVNFVESGFGRLRSSSAAGAQGPMQFLPSTWRRYGLGGDVHDPHDAILGAADYLRANGAPADLRRALLAYNHSPLYVDAVLRYARRMQVDRRAFYRYYSWQVFVRTPSGDRRLTGPGR